MTDGGRDERASGWAVRLGVALGVGAAGAWIAGLMHAVLEGFRLFGPLHGWVPFETLPALVAEAALLGVLLWVPAALATRFGLRGAVAVSLLGLVGIQALARAERPSAVAAAGDHTGRTVVLITTDTLRRDHVSAYDDAVASDLTPRIDGLLADGLRFDDAVSVAPITLPAHASLLTGLLPSEHGVVRNSLVVPNQDSVAGRMDQAGYRTAAFVSTAVLSRQMGLGDWFEVYRDPSGPLAGARELYLARRADDLVRDWTGVGHSRTGKQSGAITVRRALAWLGAQPPQASVFLWVHLYDAHEPHWPHPELSGQDTRAALGHPCDWSAHPAALKRGPPRTFMPHRRPIPEVSECRELSWNTTDRLVDSYAVEVRFLDQQVGALIDGMERMGRWRDAGVVLVADHGESLTEHQAFVGHEHWLYEPVIRIPLGVRDPACVDCAGTIRTESVDSVRVAQTLARLGGVELPGARHGPALHEVGPSLGVAVGPSASSGLSRAGEGGGPLQAVVRRDALKVLVDEAGNVERYDLALDPGERSPRLTADEQAALKAHVARTLAAWERGEGIDGVLPLGPSLPLSPLTRRALEQPGVLGTEALPEETVRYDAVEAAAREVLAEARRTASAIDDRAPPDEVREALEALGYVE